MDPMTILLVGSLLSSLVGAGAKAYAGKKRGEVEEEAIEFQRGEAKLSRKEREDERRQRQENWLKEFGFQEDQASRAIQQFDKQFGLAEKQFGLSERQFAENLLGSMFGRAVGKERLGMEKATTAESLLGARQARRETSVTGAQNRRVANLQYVDMLQKAKLRRNLSRLRVAQTKAQPVAAPMGVG